ncbi:MAG: hypothetical protein GY796_08175 [Chloroflexi bacterium]|nr:hypothetical protein [Chloroflexota bacterium]
MDHNIKNLRFLLLVLVVCLNLSFTAFLFSRQTEPQATSRDIMFAPGPMSAGLRSLPNNQWIVWRNSTTITDVNGIKINASDILEIGVDMQIDDFTQGSLNRWATSESLDDDAEITVLAAINAPGWGAATTNDGAEYCPFLFTAAGAVTLLADATANCANSDSDTDLSIYDSGGNGIHIRNRIGSTQTVKAWVQY